MQDLMAIRQEECVSPSRIPLRLTTATAHCCAYSSHPTIGHSPTRMLRIHLLAHLPTGGSLAAPGPCNRTPSYHYILNLGLSARA